MANEIELGDVVKDTISGFQGVAVGWTRWLYGCDRITVQPQTLHEGKPIVCESFDLPQLVLVKKRVVKLQVKDANTPGGPRPTPSRANVPSRR